MGAMFIFGCSACCCSADEQELNAKALGTDEYEPHTSSVMLEEAACELIADPVKLVHGHGAKAQGLGQGQGSPKVARAAAAAAAASAAPVRQSPKASADVKTVDPSKCTGMRGGQPAARDAPKVDGVGNHPGFTFMAELQRHSLQDDFGIDLFSDGEALEINSLRSGRHAAASYNDSVKTSLQLQPGFLVLSVNGVAGDARRMWSEWQSQTRVSCEICHPSCFPIHFERDGPLGIDVIHSHTGVGVSLVLDGILDGPLALWNIANPDMTVRRLDRIVAVNGCRGTPPELKEALRSTMGAMTLIIARRT